MYDVIYIDAHGSETPVAQHLNDRTDAVDVSLMSRMYTCTTDL